MSFNELRLITLGRLALEGGDGEAAAGALSRQRRKLAVLAVLALSDEPVSRDALTDMFWGEQDELRARHSLSEALSHLRRVLGARAITARGAEVELDARAPLTVDARELASAVAAERWSDAVGGYGGPFLDGVHPGGSTRLESWIADRRRELERLFVLACEREYARLRGAALWEDAAGVARRWLQADPLSEAAALALLGALEAEDTAEADARALSEYEALRARLTREYGASPGKRVVARSAVLAERVAAAGAVAVRGGAPAPARVPADTLVPEATSSPATPGGGAQGAAAPSVRRGSWRRRAAWIGVATGAFALAVAGLTKLSPERQPLSPSTIAVLPFAVRGPAEYAYLREGVMDLLSADLDGAGRFRTVDPQVVLVVTRERKDAGPAVGRELGRRLGAGLFLQGDVVVAGGRLRISAALFGQEDRAAPLAEATVDGPPDDLFLLVDRLAAQLLGASGSPVPQLGRLAALTTTSLPALKAYLEGEADYRQGLYASAFEAFRDATERDSTFALAHYRTAQAANWAVPPGWGWDSVAARSARAAAQAHRLAPRTRLLVEAYAAWVNGAYDDAERAYRAVVRTYPDDVEAWNGLGEVLFHTNPVRARAVAESLEPFEHVSALERDHLGALTHRLRILLRERRFASADSLVARLDSLEPPPASAEFHALRAFAHGTPGERDRAVAELRASGNDEMVRTAANRVAIFTGDLQGAARIAQLLLDPGLGPDVRAHAHVWLAELEVARGRWREADRQLAAAAALTPWLALEERGLLAALPFAPNGASRAAAAERQLAGWDAEHTPATGYPWLAVYNGLHGALRQYLLGLAAVRRGDLEGARRWAAELGARGGGREPRELARGLAQALRAHAAVAEGRSGEALARLDSARLRISEGLLESQFGSQAYERWTRAELLNRTGRPREALPWYATLAETTIDGVIWLPMAELRQGEILDSLGQRRAAAAHYARFVELWRDADPELAPQVARARERLRALGQPAG